MVYESQASKKIGKRRKGSLDPIRDDLQKMLDEANLRVEKLFEAGIQSGAMAEAFNSLPKKVKEGKTIEQYLSEGGKLFSTEDKHKFQYLIKEGNRINTFLGDSESQLAVAKHNISFHTQMDMIKNTGFRFGNLPEDKVKLAMRIFRRLERPEASRMYAAGDASKFDSDEMINVIYDSLEGYYPGIEEADTDTYYNMQEEAYNNAIDLLDKWGLIEKSQLSGEPKMNVDVNIVDNLNNSMSAEEYLEKRKNYINF